MIVQKRINFLLMAEMQFCPISNIPVFFFFFLSFFYSGQIFSILQAVHQLFPSLLYSSGSQQMREFPDIASKSLKGDSCWPG